MELVWVSIGGDVRHEKVHGGELSPDGVEAAKTASSYMREKVINGQSWWMKCE